MMKIIKKTIYMLLLIFVVMLIVPLIAVNTVKADAGMLVAIALFFVVNPILSLFIGIASGKDIRFFWFMPIVIAILFWIFSSLTFKTAFPIFYSAIYLAISAVAMGIAWLINRKN